MAFEHAFPAGHHDFGERRREEAAQLRHPLELLDLLCHPPLERPIPLRELCRLRADRVVVALDPHERAHAQQQLLLVERLRHEVVGAGADPVDPRLALVRGDHDDGHLRPASHAAADLEAVDAGQHDVEEHQVETVVLEGREGAFARGRTRDLNARAFE